MNSSFLMSAAIRTVFQIFPITLPFFPPGKWSTASEANFLRQILLLHPFHNSALFLVHDMGPNLIHTHMIQIQSASGQRSSGFEATKPTNRKIPTEMVTFNISPLTKCLRTIFKSCFLRNNISHFTRLAITNATLCSIWHPVANSTASNSGICFGQWADV